MRRALSLFFVLFFGLGPLMATLDAGDDARLPPCCRRHGAHHCAMSDAMKARMVQAASRTPVFTAPSRCPLYPSNTRVNMAPVHALAPAPASHPGFVSRAFTPIAGSATARMSRIRRCLVRGPPNSISC